MIRNYRDLIAWQRSMDLVVEIYELSSGWPREHRYEITSQIRRAANSIPSNIAEGQGRGTDAQFLAFLGYAYGSLRELETQLEIAKRIKLVDHEASARAESLASETGRLIQGLMKSIEK
ncbi:MAG: four helix bundle protein [Thermomicrobiales bacterium]|nr:four helix bundle protein [Thermomicrobiales bacterium]